MISSAVKPKMRSAAAFQVVTTPSSRRLKMASLKYSTTAASWLCKSGHAAAARARFVATLRRGDG